MIHRLAAIAVAGVTDGRFTISADRNPYWRHRVSGKGPGVAAALIGAAAVITAALITTRTPICPESICGLRTPTADARPSSGHTNRAQIPEDGSDGGGGKPAPAPKPAIALSPKKISCTVEDGCSSEVVIKSTGNAQLKITYMEFASEEEGYFSPDPDRSCEHRDLDRGESCSFTLNFESPPEGGTVTDTLIIHHNVGPDPSHIALQGQGSIPTPAPTELPTGD
jgi:hypothetical protein